MERAVELKHAEYAEARLASYFRFCTKLAAGRMVEFERAKNELEEHRLVCVSAATAGQPVQALLGFTDKEKLLVYPR
jgi:hypothetical protein